MRWLYTVFDILIAAGPLVAIRFWLGGFWRHARTAVTAICLTAIPWIVLDVAAHTRGWWEYNPQFILGLRIFGLPLEEIAFFFVVPLASLVVWYGISQRVAGTVARKVSHTFLGIVMILCVALLVGFLDRERTVVEAGIVLMAALALWGSHLVVHRAWWLWNGVMLLLFLICNAILTAAPIVMYNRDVITGWYVGTIPFEDFLYNFSLLNILLILFNRTKK